MRVRLYQPADAVAVIALKRDTICRVNSWDYSLEQVRAWMPDDNALLQWPQRIAGRFVVVAEADGQIVGFSDVGSDGHIDQFYVHSDHQRRGIGRAMLMALLEQARRAGTPFLFSEVSITARPFFESNGFRIDARQTVTAKGIEFINYRMSRPTGAVC